MELLGNLYNLGVDVALDCVIGWMLIIYMYIYSFQTS